MVYQRLHPGQFPLLFVILSVSSILARAYYIDDSDGNISFLPSVWNAPPIFLDVTKLYGGGCKDAYCHTADNCRMRISFNGSGITLYAAVRYALSFNVQIDQGTATSHHFDGVWNCCPAGIQPAYNLTIYNIQSLSLGSHTLDLALLDVTEGNRISDYSSIQFDYAAVNTTSAFSAAPSSSAIPSSSAVPSSSSIIGPAVGGAVGGIAVISAFILGLFYVSRRTRARDSGRVNPDPNSLATMSNAAYVSTVGASQPYHSNDNSNPQSLPVVQHTIPKLAAFPEPPIDRISHISPPSPSASRTGPIASPSISVMSSTNTNTPLTPEETQFLRGLYNLSTVPSDVAARMDELRARQQAPIGAREVSSRAAYTLPESEPGHAPPSYDSVV